MDERARTSSGRIFHKHRFRYLFTSLLVLLVLQPFVEDLAYFRVLLGVIITAVFISAIFAISQKPRDILIASFLALPTLTLTWSFYFTDSVTFFLVSRLSGIAFLVFVIIKILTFIFGQDQITRDLIIGAAVVYILMAVTWSFVYQIIGTLHPGSFAMPDGQLQSSPQLFLYYSLVTITTLGFGDVTPLTSVASSFSTLEAIVGQLYLVITVAWLVGVYVSQSIRKKPRSFPKN